MPEFIPGLQLSEAFYLQAVRPILDAHFPGQAHTAALIGYGSDVLGFDTPVSRDHEWGPRLILFLPPDSFESLKPAIHETLRQELPVQFLGYSTHFSSPDPRDGGVQVLQDIDHGPVNHHVSIDTIAGFWQANLGVDPFCSPPGEPPGGPTAAAWLTFSEQRLLSLTAGKVFHDDLGLEAVRKRFAYYPHDVWLYLLANQWNLISQEEAFVGRTWSTGDELGSRIITARLVERLMRLCFLMEKRYAPYSKWFGAAFKRLACYPHISRLLEGAIASYDFPTRERFLAQAYTLAAEMHNALNITPPRSAAQKKDGLPSPPRSAAQKKDGLPSPPRSAAQKDSLPSPPRSAAQKDSLPSPLETRTRTYSGWHALRAGVTDLPLNDPRNTRPFQCIFGSRFEEVLLEAIQDPEVLAFTPSKGSVSQFLVESSGALEDVSFCRGLEDDLSPTRKD